VQSYLELQSMSGMFLFALEIEYLSSAVFICFVGPINRLCGFLRIFVSLWSLFSFFLGREGFLKKAIFAGRDNSVLLR
jgi:hypothetical protein